MSSSGFELTVFFTEPFHRNQNRIYINNSIVGTRGILSALPACMGGEFFESLDRPPLAFLMLIYARRHAIQEGSACTPYAQQAARQGTFFPS